MLRIERALRLAVAICALALLALAGTGYIEIGPFCDPTPEYGHNWPACQ